MVGKRKQITHIKDNGTEIIFKSFKNKYMTDKVFTYIISAFILFSLNSLQAGAENNPANKQKTINTEKYWSKADKIVKSVKAPKFPDKVYKITDFGAISDGTTLNTKAINKAITECSLKGGGTVLVPSGVFKTGAIHLQNNVNLKIAEGAELRFSTNPKDYLPLVETSWEGVLCMNYSPLIYASNKKNVAVTGKGLLNGMGSPDDWWNWIPLQRKENNRPQLDNFNEERVPVSKRIMGEGHYLRPHFIQFYKCKNVLIEGVTIENSPFWVTHPLLSENVIVRGITVSSMGPNNDGCDPESCKNVLIENCVFDTGDDCIALKSGRNQDGRELKTPIENVVIKDCFMKNGHGGVVIGSEVSGGARNIFAEGCRMDSPLLERAVRIKTSSQRGGVVERIFVRNIEVGQVSDAVVLINCKYSKPGNFPPLVKDVFVSEITAQKTNYGIRLQGLEENESIQNIRVENCDFKNVQIPEKVEYVTGLVVKNVLINGRKFTVDTQGN